MQQWIIFFTYFLVLPVMAKDTSTLIINTPFNTPHSDLFITGNSQSLCHWRPTCLKLEKIYPNVYKVEVPKNIEFKITRGSWQSEAATTLGAPLESFYINDENNAVFTIKNWKDLGPLKSVGNIHKYQEFFSPQLNNFREIHIWLPPSYSEDTKKDYPVLYFHDGQNAFDPKSSNFGVDWSIDDIAQQMIKKNQIREFIIVAIFSKNRNHEFNYNSLGKKYARFLVHTIKPFVDEKYRTLPDRKHTFLMGSSYGAVISFSILWTFPHIFSQAVGLSLPASSFKRVLFSLVNNTPGPIQKVSFDLDHGTLGLDSRYAFSAKSFFRLLSKKNKHHFKYRIFPYAGHTETDWARRLPLYLRQLFRNHLTE